MSFRIHAVSPDAFAPLFALGGDALRSHLARRVVVDSPRGYPCRVSLEDAPVGETVLLVHFEHQPANTPFRSSHAIYVREGVPRAEPAPDEVPTMLSTRLISLRGFDGGDMLVAGSVVPGADLADELTAMLEDPAVAYVHLHNAKMGCYFARATRA